MDMDLLREFAEKKIEIRRLQAQAESLQKWITANEPTLLEQFTEEGIQNVKLDGIGTAMVHSQLWAGAWQDDDGVSDMQVTCDALKAAGLGLFVNEAFNHNTVSSWVREQPQDELGDPILPGELGDKLRVTRRFSIRVRKASE